MKVVLLQDIAKVGKKFDVKEVSSGYARNFLIARKLAEPATGKNLKGVEKMRAHLAEKTQKHMAHLSEMFGTIAGKKLTLKTTSNEKGGLFANIDQTIIQEFLVSQGVSLPTSEYIELEAPIKKIGEYPILLKAGEVETKFTLVVETK